MEQVKRRWREGTGTMGHDAKIKVKKKAYREDDLDRLLESVLHQLYVRNPKRFMVIYERLKADLERAGKEKGLRHTPDMV